ncbi:MAG: 30S ribosomal protein S4e [Candidatus Aenigmatarchaeota archaeon]
MTRHQKALSSPKTYPIKRKERSWAIKPSPGPHSEENCVPLGIIVRDVLGYAETVSEVKGILEEDKCSVDGRKVRDHRFPLGIFDSLRLGDEYFRLVPSKKGFELVRIDKQEAGKKLCRVEDKNVLKGGEIQLALNDGRTVVADGELKDIDTGSSLILSLEDNECDNILKLEEGQDVMIMGGKNRGEFASFIEKKILKGSREDRVLIEQDGEEIDLPQSLVIPIDKDEIKIEAEE